jgi:hypothetical protein
MSGSIYRLAVYIDPRPCVPVIGLPAPIAWLGRWPAFDEVEVDGGTAAGRAAAAGSDAHALSRPRLEKAADRYLFLGGSDDHTPAAQLPDWATSIGTWAELTTLVTDLGQDSPA